MFSRKAIKKLAQTLGKTQPLHYKVVENTLHMLVETNGKDDAAEFIEDLQEYYVCNYNNTYATWKIDFPW